MVSIVVVQKLNEIKLAEFILKLNSGTEAVDWSYAQHELLKKQGVDLRKEMQARSVCVC